MQGTLDTAGNGHAAPALREVDFPRVIDIEIDPPIDIGGQVHTTLHLEEPKFQDVRIAENELIRDQWGRNTEGSYRNYEAVLVSRVTGVPRQVLDQMRVTQVDQAFLFLIGFKQPGQATGES